MIGALIFPLGLVMIVLTGADLFTGTNMYTAVSVLHGRLPWWKMLLHWFICFWGNLAGSLFTMALIFGWGGVFDADPYKSEVIAYVTKKQVTPDFHQIFLRAIGCNWLVCLACYLAMQAKDLNSKIVGMWWPIFAFVSLGLDHVVANMFFIPMGIWLGTPGVTVGLYIWKGIIPAGLGNIVGGAIFCGGYYWFMFIFQEPEIIVDGAGFVPYEPHAIFGQKRRAHHDVEAEEGSDGKAVTHEVTRDGNVAGG
jgi:formate/nitrite transporter